MSSYADFDSQKTNADHDCWCPMMMTRMMMMMIPIMMIPKNEYDSYDDDDFL